MLEISDPIPLYYEQKSKVCGKGWCVTSFRKTKNSKPSGTYHEHEPFFFQLSMHKFCVARTFTTKFKYELVNLDVLIGN